MPRLFSRARWWPATRHPVQAALGPLERGVMEVLWEARDLSVREVQSRLGRPSAYTTVMTTLDRLYKKGFVQRRRDGRAFLYTAAIGRHEIEATVTSTLLSDLLSGGAGAPLLSNLVDVVAERDDRLLEELERLVKDKRDSLRKGRE